MKTLGKGGREGWEEEEERGGGGGGGMVEGQGDGRGGSPRLPPH